MVEQHGRPATWRCTGTRDVRGHRFNPVEIELPGFEHVALTLLLVPLARGDRTTAIRQMSKQRVQLAPTLFGVRRALSACRPFLCVSSRIERSRRCERKQVTTWK